MITSWTSGQGLYGSEPVGNEGRDWSIWKVKRSETDMWNDLCIFLVANDVKCRIIYS